MNWSCCLLPIVLATIFGAVQADVLHPPTVKTKNGLIAGYVKSLDEGKTAYVYEGIPYAKAPVGELRFQKTQPAENWTGVYNATKFRAACMQPDQLVPDNNIPETTHKSEDCLYLTVYRPPTESTKPRAVMMWIHGGGFETGSIFSVAYDGSYIATMGDVIVVPIQYRLGSFGFLYGQTEDTPGNAGLYDQIAALKWIQENIAAFGGDPHQVTVFGESAGGMSVGALVLSPLAHGLFRRAVLQSGAPNSYLGSESKAQAMVKTNALLESVNCTKGTPTESVKCLRNTPATALVKATEHARTNGESFEPVYGEPLLPTKPSVALKEGKFNRNLDLLFGTVSEEGALFVESLFPAQLDPDLPRANVTITVAQAKFIISLMFQIFKEDAIREEVAEFYTKGLKEEDKDAIRQAVAYAFGDFHIACPTVLFGEYYGRFTAADRVYAYRVVQPPAIPVFLKCRNSWMGVCHGDDVLFLFGFPLRLRGIVFTEEDYKLSVDMITAWTTFAKTGKPTSPMSNGAKWAEAIEHGKA
ncbi:hypothetical protein TYRP_009105 [Tyrophagus putrescentiae]|nr:hypothetical protein TYRP_009105 [Tyrophagus putrescentiae]